VTWSLPTLITCFSFQLTESSRCIHICLKQMVTASFLLLVIHVKWLH
jgi:hypothetical protein